MYFIFSPETGKVKGD